MHRDLEFLLRLLEILPKSDSSNPTVIDWRVQKVHLVAIYD